MQFSTYITTDQRCDIMPGSGHVSVVDDVGCGKFWLEEWLDLGLYPGCVHL